MAASPDQAVRFDESGDGRFLRVLLEHASDGIVMLGPAGAVVAATPGIGRMLGYEPGQLVGLDGLSLVHPDEQEYVALRLAEYLTGETQGPDLRARLRRKDGSWVPVELVAPDARPAVEEVGGVVVNVRDLSRQQGAEHALRHARMMGEAVAKVAASLVDTDPDELDEVFERALAMLGAAAGVDRACLFESLDGSDRMTRTHEWCEPTIARTAGSLGEMTGKACPRWFDLLARGHTIHIRSVARLDDKWRCEREMLSSSGTCAVVAVPIIRAGRLRGFLRFDSAVRERTWADETLRMFRTVAELVASLRARFDAQAETRAHDARWRALVQRSSDVVLVLDRQLRITFVSGRPIFGYGPDRSVGRVATEFVHPDDLDVVLEELDRLVDGEQPRAVELRLLAADGTWCPAEVLGYNLFADPAIAGLVLNLRDISERKRAHAELRGRDEQLRSLIASVPGAVYRCDPAAPWRFEFVSEAIEDLTGYPPVDFLEGRATFADLVLTSHVARAGDERLRLVGDRRPFVLEYPIRHRDGTTRWVSERGQGGFGDAGRPEWIDGVIFDVTANKELEQRLAHDAAHDPLTGLPNRTELLAQLNRELIRAARTTRAVAVLFIDLDRFKLVNDALGHAAGDELLVAFAERLRGALRGSDFAARTGGDEFVVVCPDIRSALDAERVARRVARTLATPIDVRGRELFVTASIGIAVTDVHPDAPALLRDADAAAYQAKEQGRNRHVVFDETLRAATTAALETETALHQAIDRDELLLRYQPVVDLNTGALVAVEGLLRWQHPRRGLIGPEQFLPAAEASGLIVPIGRRVIQLACGAIVGASDRGLRVAVNLSPRELAQPDLVNHVERTLRDAGVEPECLCLEITESALLEDIDAALATLAALKAVGVLLAIDDFGTGYSSLSYLRRLPVDTVKIDQSFVAELGTAEAGDKIVAGIVALAAGLGLDVIAEGIERPEQAATLRTFGCTLGQGYLYSEPVTLDQALAACAAGV